MGKAIPSVAPGPGRVERAERRIALLLTSLDNDYEWSVRAGIQVAVSERRAALVSVFGSAVDDPNPEQRARSFTFDLLGKDSIDAMLALSGTLGRFVGPVATGTWLDRYRVPTCSIGALDHVASIVIENSEGTARLVAHLIAEHGYRRIAFVRGPELSAEAQARYLAYREVLAEYGIEEDPRLVLDGDFTRPSGVRAARRLFDEHQITADDVDAIVAANDHMAIGVIEELVHRGVTVPDRIAVVGFDDSKSAQSIHPSLTTVRQPTERLGREGVRSLFALLDGQEHVPTRSLPTELILRRSCGCTPTDGPPTPTGLPADLERIARRTYASKSEDWDTLLVEALLRETRGRGGDFERALEPLLQRLLHAQADLVQVQDLLTVLRARALADSMHDPSLPSRIEDAVHAARITVSRLQARAGLHSAVSDVTRINALSQALNARMFGPPAPISAALVEHLPALGFDGCVVSELITPGPDGELEVAFGFHAEDVQPKTVRYPAQALIPPDFSAMKRQSVVVLPLTYGAESLGIAIVPARSSERRTYELLRDVLATALKGRMLARAAQRVPRD